MTSLQSLGLVIILGLLCAVGAPVAAATGDGTVLPPEDLKQRLIGTWELEEVSIDNNGVRQEPFGKHPLGMLMFDGNGRFMVFFSQADIPKFAGARPTGTDKENKGVVQGSLAYFGTYELPSAGKVIMHIKGSTFPNFNGADQTRSVRISEKQELVIFNGAPSAGPGMGASLWKRLPSP